MTDQKSRPILFSGPMARAILDGRKTQTRRLVSLLEFDATDTPGYDFRFRDRQMRWHDYRRADFIAKKCPFGAPGDLLWVRETWRVHGGQEYEYQQDRSSVMYRADMDMGTLDLDWEWRPSIFMPRWASRITLRVESARVERLHAITEEDAIAEGLNSRAEFSAGWDTLHKPGDRWADNPWVWVVGFRKEAP